jgi:hypothetical protein
VVQYIQERDPERLALALEKYALEAVSISGNKKERYSTTSKQHRSGQGLRYGRLPAMPERLPRRRRPGRLGLRIAIRTPDQTITGGIAGSPQLFQTL